MVDVNIMYFRPQVMFKQDSNSASMLFTCDNSAAYIVETWYWQWVSMFNLTHENNIIFVE